MSRDEVVARFERYVDRFELPVHFGMRVASVDQKPGSPGYMVRTNGVLMEARNVVVAACPLQRPKLPAFRCQLPDEVVQLHSGQYYNPQSPPAGAALVIGSGQSGC
jgi:putative flavoprotein involved in K+ transport